MHVHLDQSNFVNEKEKKHTDPVLEDCKGIFNVDGPISE